MDPLERPIRGRGRGRRPVVPPSQATDYTEPPRLLETLMQDLTTRVPRETRPTGISVRGVRHIPDEATARRINDFVVTRPKHPDFIKCGTQGRTQEMYTNYFQVEKDAGWVLYHYDISFTATHDDDLVELDSRTKRKIIRSQAEKFGDVFVFDGSSLFTSKRLLRVPANIMEFTVIENDIPILVKTQLVKQLDAADPTRIHIFNILTRKCLGLLGLKLLGRNFFNPDEAVVLPHHRLELWPGFITTLRNHDAGLLYCVQLTTKVIRMDTALNIILAIQAEGRNGRMSQIELEDRIRTELVGCIVLTKYNPKTYRIDDISFNEKVTDSFERRDGSRISFLDYFNTR